MSEKLYSIKDLEKILNQYREELAKEYHTRNFFVFGSYARGEQTPDSDIDILVELKTPLGLKFFKLEKVLEKIFGKKVDLATPNGLKPFIRDKVLHEAIKL